MTVEHDPERASAPCPTSRGRSTAASGGTGAVEGDLDLAEGQAQHPRSRPRPALAQRRRQVRRNRPGRGAPRRPHVDDARHLVVSFGTTGPVRRLRRRRAARRGPRASARSVRSRSGRSRPTRSRRAAAGCEQVLVYELNAGQMVDDVRLAVNGAVPVHSIGGVSQDESGMRQGELLDVDKIRARILAAIGRSRAMSQGTPRQPRRGAREGRAASRPTSCRPPTTTCARAAGTRSRGASWSRCSTSLSLVDRSIGVVGPRLLHADHHHRRRRVPPVPARPRAGGRHRHEAHAPRPRHLHAPGRRRHGVGGPGRGAAHRGARRVDHVHPPRQRRVRRHRRPDDRDHDRRPAHEDRRRRAVARPQYGYPIPIADIVAQFPGVAYVARGAVDRPNAVSRTRRYLREAFESQLAGEGFSLVEILTMCPTGWSVPADQGAEYQRDQRNLTYPLGELRRTLTVDVRIHDILTRAAAVAPRAMRRHPRRRAANLRRPRRRLQPGRAPPGGRGRRAPRPGGVVGADRPRRPRVCYGVSKLGAALAPINPGLHRARGRHRRIEYLRPRRRRRASRATRSRRADRGADSASPSSSLTPSGSTARRATPLPRVGTARIRAAIFLTSGSTGVPRPRSSRIARPGCARSARHRGRVAGTQRRSRDVRAVPHGGLVLHRARVGGRTGPCTWCTAPMPTSCSARSSAGARARLYCIPAVWQRILDDGGTRRHRRRCARCSPARRASTSTSSTR